MNYRRLGNTGITVSEIGFGSWGIGGLTEGATSYGPTDDNESRLALLSAFHNGITLYDTSDIYGNGHSEELIGETLRPVRSKIVIASKGGFTKHRGPHNVSTQFLRERLEGSLRRLRTDYIDVYQLHSPPMSMVTPEVVETLESFRLEGKIRAFGFSLKDPLQGLAAIILGFKSLQVNFNMLDQRAWKNGLFPLAEQKSVGLIGRTPFNFGFLAGNGSELNFDPRDHRSNWSQSQLERWAKAPDLFSFLNNKKERTNAQLALQFCLSFKAISSVIPGILHPGEALENAIASDLGPLTLEELEVISQINANNTFFEKST